MATIASVVRSPIINLPHISRLLRQGKRWNLLCMAHMTPGENFTSWRPASDVSYEEINVLRHFVKESITGQKDKKESRQLYIEKDDVSKDNEVSQRESLTPSPKSPSFIFKKLTSQHLTQKSLNIMMDNYNVCRSVGIPVHQCTPTLLKMRNIKLQKVAEGFAEVQMQFHWTSIFAKNRRHKRFYMSLNQLFYENLLSPDIQSPKEVLHNWIGSLSIEEEHRKILLEKVTPDDLDLPLAHLKTKLLTQVIQCLLPMRKTPIYVYDLPPHFSLVDAVESIRLLATDENALQYVERIEFERVIEKLTSSMVKKLLTSDVKFIGPLHVTHWMRGTYFGALLGGIDDIKQKLALFEKYKIPLDILEHYPRLFSFKLETLQTRCEFWTKLYGQHPDHIPRLLLYHVSALHRFRELTLHSSTTPDAATLYRLTTTSALRCHIPQFLKSFLEEFCEKHNLSSSEFLDNLTRCPSKVFNLLSDFDNCEKVVEVILKHQLSLDTLVKSSYIICFPSETVDVVIDELDKQFSFPWRQSPRPLDFVCYSLTKASTIGVLRNPRDLMKNIQSSNGEQQDLQDFRILQN